MARTDGHLMRPGRRDNQAILMRIFIAGRDRTAELVERLSRAEAARTPLPGPVPCAPHHSALSLLQASDVADYQRLLLYLTRLRRGIDTRDFPIPRKPGLKGTVLARMRAALWKVLRYQHDRMAFQQNVLTELLVSALEFEHEERERELEMLRRRVAVLEQREGSRA